MSLIRHERNIERTTSDYDAGISANTHNGHTNSHTKGLCKLCTRISWALLSSTYSLSLSLSLLCMSLYPLLFCDRSGWHEPLGGDVLKFANIMSMQSTTNNRIGEGKPAEGPADRVEGELSSVVATY